MEDSLELYQQPTDPDRPVICMDESFKQLFREQRQALPARPGRPARIDYTYKPAGVCNVFMCFDPLRGWRDVWVAERRTQREWALCIQRLVDVHYPHAQQIRLVVDNLNTHTLAALYATFEASQARRLAQKLELHYTPKHGSWLNMVEIELSVLMRQCLDGRIEHRDAVQQAAWAWQARRNRAASTVAWRFTTADARIKLKRLYPSIQP
jgi:hypothetical protein